VLLAGEGPRFCAGGDVASFIDAQSPSAYLRRLASELECHMRGLGALPKPVVAAVHGAVAGAGLALVLNADVVVAAASTKLVFAYPGVGLTPDCGVSWLLPRAIGQQRALDLALTGRVLNANEAREWGLVAEVVDDHEVHARAAGLARLMADGATAAFGHAKRLIRSSFDASRANNAADEVDTIARMVDTADAQRLMARFTSRGSGA